MRWIHEYLHSPWNWLFEKNSHLCEIYQSRQVGKNAEVYFYEDGNAFQCNFILQDTTFLFWLEGQTFISEYADRPGNSKCHAEMQSQ